MAFYDDSVERQALDLESKTTQDVMKSVLGNLGAGVKIVPEHAPAREVRAQAFELAGQEGRARAQIA